MDLRVAFEDRFTPSVLARLAELGHEIEVVHGWTATFGGAQMIHRDPNGTLTAASDPRREAYAIAHMRGRSGDPGATNNTKQVAKPAVRKRCSALYMRNRQLPHHAARPFSHEPKQNRTNGSQMDPRTCRLHWHASACGDMPFNINYDAFSRHRAPRPRRCPPGGRPRRPTDLDAGFAAEPHRWMNPCCGKWRRALHPRLPQLRLRRGRVLAPTGPERVLAYFDEMKSEHPRSAEMIEEAAPSVFGSDPREWSRSLPSARIRTGSNSRWRTTAATSWCWSSRASGAAPCREEYPYQREMMEKYADEPVVLLGVNSDNEARNDPGGQGARGVALPHLVGRLHATGRSPRPGTSGGGRSTFIWTRTASIRFVNKRQEGDVRRRWTSCWRKCGQ